MGTFHFRPIIFNIYIPHWPFTLTRLHNIPPFCLHYYLDLSTAAMFLYEDLHSLELLIVLLRFFIYFYLYDLLCIILLFPPLFFAILFVTLLSFMPPMYCLPASS